MKTWRLQNRSQRIAYGQDCQFTNRFDRSCNGMSDPGVQLRRSASINSEFVVEESAGGRRACTSSVSSPKRGTGPDVEPICATVSA